MLMPHMKIVIDKSVSFNPIAQENLHADMYIGKCIEGVFNGFNVFHSDYTNSTFVLVFNRPTTLRKEWIEYK